MSEKTVLLGSREVGDGCPPYIIAEACINHQGDPDLAKKMVYVAHAMGCDAIKFQLHVLDDEMLREAPQSANFEQPLYDTLDQTNLSLETHKELMSLCGELGIDYMCTPFSRASADILNEMGLPFFKTGSGELTNIPFQRHIARIKKPVIVSTGMSLTEEIQETVDAVKAEGAPLILTHCVSAYPAPYNIINLGNIPKMRQMFDVPVGLSDHSIGIYTSLGAVALGACVIEKHFTLDRNMEGPDHESSLEPYELGELVKGCRAVFEASGERREIFGPEQEIVAWARESVVSITDIPKGTILTEKHISVKRPSPQGDVIPANRFDDVIGKTAAVDIESDRQVNWGDLE